MNLLKFDKDGKPILPNKNEINEAILDEYRRLFNITEFDKDTVGYRTILMSFLSEIVLTTLNEFLMINTLNSPTGATGANLDKQVSYYPMVGRHQPKKLIGEAIITFNKSKETIVPKGTKLKDYKNNIFETIALAKGNQSKSVNISIQSLESKNIKLELNEVLHLVSPISGISTIKSAGIYIGVSLEIDNELRTRLINYLSKNNKQNVFIRDKILNLDNVIEVRVYENKEGSPDSAGTPPKETQVVVRGGNSQDIVDVLYEFVGPNIIFFGQVSAIPNGSTTPLYFTRTTPRPITNITINWKQRDSYNENINESNFKSNVLIVIVDYINNLHTGSDINYDVLYELINETDYLGIHKVKDVVKINLSTTDSGGDEFGIVVGALSYATISVNEVDFKKK